MLTKDQLAKNHKIYSNSMRFDVIKLFDKSYSKILDVGCSTGNTGVILKEAGLCTWVTGIEISDETGNIAKDRIDKVIIGSIEKALEEIPDSSFDCICCLDVLEHLVNPWSVMSSLSKKLRPNGIIITSIPNIRYISVLIKLIIFGKWEYKDSGILDRTHLRFFTKKSCKALHIQENLIFEKIEVLIPRKFKILNLIGLGIFKDFFSSHYLIRSRKVK